MHKIPEANSAPQNSGTQYVTTTVEGRRQAEGERQSVRKRGGGAGSVCEIENMWKRLEEEEEDGVKRLLNVVTHKIRPCSSVWKGCPASNN